MTGRRVRLLVLGALLAQAASAAAAVTVRVTPEVVVERDDVTVGEIAVVEGDEPLAGRIRALRFGVAPPPGGRHRLDGDIVRARLRQASIDPARVHLVIPERLVIARSFQVVPLDALVDAVRREARQQIAGAGDDLALIPIGRPADLRVATGDVALIARLSDASPNPVFLAAAVTVRVGGRDVQTVPLTFRVGRYHQVAVATRALDPRGAVGAADLRLERRLTTDTPADALVELPTFDDLEVTQPVKAGDVLTPRVLRARVVVKRGDLVTLVLEGNGFRIAAQGQAGEDARRGDTVRVLNASSRREVMGRVEGPGIVRVPFEESRSLR